MQTTREDLIREEVNQTFATVWFVSILVAVVSAVPLYLLRDTNPHFIAIPILIGVGLNILFELLRQPFTVRGRSFHVESPRIESFSGSFENFSGLNEILVIELTNRGGKGKPKAPAGQLDLDIKMSKVESNLRRLRIFQTHDGKKLIAMDCDRFVELLVTDVVEAADKTLEASLLNSLKRFVGSSMPTEQLYLISNDIARNVIKSDIRGNLLVHLTRNGELTVKRVLKQFYESEATYAEKAEQEKESKEKKEKDLLFELE